MFKRSRTAIAAILLMLVNVAFAPGFAFARQTQKINLDLPSSATMDEERIRLVGSASSRLPLSFTSRPISVCRVSGKQLLLVAAGSCSVTASQKGNAKFSKATVTKIIDISRVTQERQ